MPKFELKDTSDGQFMFNLKAPNSEIILTSERYTTKLNALTGIESVKVNAPLDARYQRKTSVADEPYFTLSASNGEVIGTSEMYSSKQAREDGIESVKTNAPIATVDDSTSD